MNTAEPSTSSEDQNSFIVDRCLYLNRQYSNELKNSMGKLQYILDSIHEEQEKLSIRIKQEKNKQGCKPGPLNRCNRKPINLFASPYFRSIRGMVAPENEDAIIKRKRNDVDAYIHPPRPWTSQEHALLANAVYDNALQIQLNPLLNREAYLNAKLEKEILPEKQETSIRNSLEVVKRKMQILKKRSKVKLIDGMKEKPDWLSISSANMNGGRTPEDCENMWNNFLHPRVNRRKFTPDEDKKLVKIVVAHNGKNWHEIAEQLGTHRTPIQCLERYQSCLNPEMLKTYWTPEEDSRLLSIIESCRIGDTIPWNQVVYYMEGRTRGQIFSRWNRHLKPESRINKWTIEEDAILYAAYVKYGKNWRNIAKYLPIRTNYSCRERIINCFFPTKGVGGWSLEDDRRLVKCYVEHGDGKWPKVATKIMNRSTKSCSFRLHYMRRKCPEKFAKAVKMCKAGRPGKEFMPESLIHSKDYPAYSVKRQNVKNHALQTLSNTVQKVSRERPRDIEEYLKTISVQTLKNLSAELLANQDYENRIRQPHYRVSLSHTRKAQIEKEKLKRKYKISSSSSSSEEEDVVVQADEEEEASQEDGLGVNQELDELFRPRCIAGIHPNRKTFVYKSRREVIEYETLRHLMFKAFEIKDNPVPECMVHNEVDFTESIQNMLNLFITSTEDGYLPVIPPNSSTTSAQMIIFALRPQLEFSAQNLNSDEALENFKMLALNDSKISRKCHACRSSESNSEVDVSDCQCALIQSLREHFLLLRKRFMSVFLWPSLLSTIPLSHDQIKVLIAHDQSIYAPKVKVEDEEKDDVQTVTGIKRTYAAPDKGQSEPDIKRMKTEFSHA